MTLRFSSDPQIVLRGPQTKTARLMRCLQRLLPARMHDRQTRSNSTKFVSAGECRLLSVMPEVAVPQPQANIFRVDFVRDVANDEVCLVKWTGSLPHKCMRIFFCRVLGGLI